MTFISANFTDEGPGLDKMSESCPVFGKCAPLSHPFLVRASQLAQASERVGSLIIPASQQG